MSTKLPQIQVFDITESAATKLYSILAAESGPDSGTLRLRVAVRPGGCSGFSYEMYLDSEASPGDLLFERELPPSPVPTERVSDMEGSVSQISALPVVVDPASAPLLKNAVLDYTDGLSGSGFKFTNPNANRTCGCGQSFS